MMVELQFVKSNGQFQCLELDNISKAMFKKKPVRYIAISMMSSDMIVSAPLVAVCQISSAVVSNDSLTHCGLEE